MISATFLQSSSLCMYPCVSAGMSVLYLHILYGIILLALFILLHYTAHQPICVSPVCLSRLPVWFLLQRNWCDCSSWQVWAVLPSAWAADCSTRWESRPHCWHCTHQSRAAGSDTCHFHSHSVIADTIVILGVMVVSLWKQLHLPSWMYPMVFYIQVSMFYACVYAYVVHKCMYVRMYHAAGHGMYHVLLHSPSAGCFIYHWKLS